MVALELPESGNLLWMFLQGKCQNRLEQLYRGVAALALASALCGCTNAVQAARQTTGSIDPAQAAQQAQQLHQYQAEVQPVLQANCYRCHAGINRRGGLDMSTRARLLQGGKDGAVVVVGQPEDSLLARVISPALPEGDPMRMPPKGARLTEANVAAIRKWIADGLVMDR